MQEIIDFTNCELNKLNFYGGGNGAKKPIIYNGNKYMLKLPPPFPNKIRQLSYKNSCVSEYISCHIFQTLGIKTQETLLGTYSENGKTKIAVACKDFTAPHTILNDFGSIKNAVTTSNSDGYGKELNKILDSLDKQHAIEPVEIKEFFWNMFVADALIGNFDRHSGNWGVLINQDSGEIELAPVYDCGSSLYPQMDEQLMKKVLANDDEINKRMYDFPSAAFRTDDGKEKISYYEYLASNVNKDCTNALKRIAPKIDLDKINQIIEGTPCITDLQKKFYKVIIQARKERIIDKALNKVIELEQQQAHKHRIQLTPIKPNKNNNDLER